jgi:hypothetical protein
MRCLPYLFIIGAVLFCVTAYAKTQDGETPAEESVCDELKWATPGLYGLCVAFCEAQDCEPDFTLANPLENCKPASRKILEKYRKKMRPGDPNMPCIQEPCPCWTQEELNLLWPPVHVHNQICELNYSIVDDLFGSVLNRDSFGLNVHEYPPPSYRLTTVQSESPMGTTPPSGPMCSFYLEEGEFLVSRGYYITFQEFLICEEQLNQKGAELGFDCFLP